ncbi:MAG TPA: hypothetical protein VJJ22_03275 [Candidatus Paceibacterota bacterium]
MNSNLKTKVMRRVYMVNYIRRAISPFAIKCYVSLISMFIFSRLVWIDRVVQNAPNVSHPFDTARFFTNAFANTELAVQALVLAIFAIGLWLVRDIVFSRRLTSSSLSPFLSHTF